MKVEAEDIAEQVDARILGAVEDGDAVRLKVAMKNEFYGKVYRFLEAAGCTYYGRERATIAMLLDYGLSEVPVEELTKNVAEMNDQMSSYAAMRFQAYEYYAQNNSITQGLRYFLHKNESLKRKLREKGLGDRVPADEWDTWDEATVDGFYRRYIK
jgi:hypothetical protein